MFEIAGTIGLAAKHGLKPALPAWGYDKYFQHPIPKGPAMRNQVKERHFHVHDWDIPATGADILGYLQSEKYFDAATIKRQFTFRDQFVQHVKSKVPKDLFNRPTIVFQIRRGDYVNNPNYYHLSIEYYIDALLTHFPDWEQCNILFFSDDLPYCKVHFECLPNAYFTDNLNDIEQMCLATLCDHFIIPNSSYGWWCAWLGEKPHSKIIHCGHLQAGKLLESNNPKDYWPERWTRHEKPSYKIPLHDVTFTIPVMHDHQDRKKNLDLCLCMLQKSFEAKFIIHEQGTQQFKYTESWATYRQRSDLQKFHRTRMLNDMCNEAETDIVFNWDCDVIVPPMQVYLSVKALRSGVQICYPYDGRFDRMTRHQWFSKVEQLTDIGVVGDAKLHGTIRKTSTTSVGGALGYTKSGFQHMGMENENFISYGPEDVERWERFHKLGAVIHRVTGRLFHMDHWIGENSCNRHTDAAANNAELSKVREMTGEQLRDYVMTWEWVKHYSADYYREISAGSERSAKEVFKALKDVGVNPAKVLDVGCGCGAWVQDGKEWTGIDYNVSESVLYPGVKYQDFDLSKLPDTLITPNYGEFDLAMCVEVAEHLPENCAAPLVELLVGHAPKVLFSAAIPYQGGHGHINEQWQTWWAEIFAKYGYYPAKKQPDIKNNVNIELWYRQNTVLYERNGKGTAVDYVLPDYYIQKLKQ